MVTRDPGDWFDESLAALGAQDYPNLAVLVLDSASAEDPTARVAAILPSAFIRRLDHNEGFAGAANAVLSTVEGASHFVFLHDDAAPDPDAVRLLVEEAYRSNAGVVTPKLVEWDDPATLLAVGVTADRGGVTEAFGRGELDQEQHDAVRDVFVAPSACMLVRADLFASLHGFDSAMQFFGEDLDFSWRAQVVGARVVVAPAARVRHREAATRGLRDVPFEPGVEPTNRLRAVLSNYGRLNLVMVVPLLIALHAGSALASLTTGRREKARAIGRAWRLNVAQLGQIRAKRRATFAMRVLPDREIKRLQTPAPSRIAAFVRGSVAVEERTFGVGAAGRGLAGSMRQGGLRLTLGVWLGIAAVLVVGSRQLVGGRVQAVGQLADLPAPVTLLRLFASGWRTTGLGSAAPAPFAFAVLGIAGSVVGGAMGFLRALLLMGALPLGLLGAHRVSSAMGSWRARLAAVLLYAASPLPYDALARGHLAGLVEYAAMPWILGRLLRSTGLAPFGAVAPPEDVVRVRAARRVHRARTSDIDALLGAEAATMDPIDTEELRLVTGIVEGVHDHDSKDTVDDGAELAGGVVHLPVAGRVAPAWRVQWLALALLLAITIGFAPPVASAIVVVAVGLAIGCAMTAQPGGGMRAAAMAAVSLGGAAVLLFPWTLELVLPGGWTALSGLGRPVARALTFADLLRFRTGPHRTGVLGWALLIPAALPLLVARRWRFGWAARLWFVALICIAVAWVSGRGWMGIPPPPAEVLLAPAALALALAGALGVAAFEADLPGYEFGWRQIASVVAAVGAAGALLPVVAGALDGRWRSPDRDFVGHFSWMDERAAEGSFRMLWIGDPEALPTMGWRLDDDVAYATSRDGPPDAVDLWPATDDGPTRLVPDAIGIARRGETSRLGHLLAPLAVRYIAIPLHPSPERDARGALRPPRDLTDALAAQVDLRLVESDDSIAVYENAAWGASRAALSGDAAVESRTGGLARNRTIELRSAPPILDEVNPLKFEGRVPGGATVFLSESASPRWQLRSGGEVAPRRRAFGWANAFDRVRGGQSTLRYRTPPARWLALLLEFALWLMALRAAVLHLRSERNPT